jgi:hypothetical protein
VKGPFHISRQELCDTIVEVEKATKNQARKKAKAKSKSDPYETESEVDLEEGQNES